MAERMELKLVMPRWQAGFVWASFSLWILMVLGIFWDESRRGSGNAFVLLLRLLQGLLVLGSCFAGFATVLEVDGEDLVVTTVWRKVIRRPGLREPMATVALEWISGRLTMQRPADGFITELGRGAAAREAADWLVARGVHPPVGG